MSTISDDCCCLMSLLRRRREESRRVSLSEDSLILPYPRAPVRRTAGQRPRCCLVTRRQRAAQGVAEWISSQEAIELKCYSLSKDRVVVSLDKRCCLLSPANGLTRTRPLSCMEDGRRHLDTRRRPDSMSLIKLCMDPESGQLKRSLSIHEIDSDNEFEELATERMNSESNSTEAKAPLDHEALVEKLSRRSLVIVERNSSTKTNLSSSSLVLDISESNDEPAAALAGDSLEHDFVESLSLGPQTHTQDEQEQEHANSYELVHAHDCEEQQQQQVVNDKKLDTFKPASPQSKPRRRKPLKFVAKRLTRWIQGHPDPMTNDGTASEREDTPTPRNLDASEQQTTQDCHDTTAAVVRENQGQLVALGRPESIFLWPQRLSDEYATTLTGGSTASSSYSSRARRSKRPPASVMISYNHMEAKEYAISLHAALEAQGVSAYLDLYDIQKGEDWQDSLNFAILDCRVFVPLVTPSYGETLWTSRECKLADVLAKRIVPINFGQRWPPPSLAIQFATLQYIDWLHHELVSVLDPHMMDEGGAAGGWPRECVQAIARQLKARLQSDLLHAVVTAARICYEDSEVSTTSGVGSAELQSAPPPLNEMEGGVATRKVHNDSKRQQQRRQQVNARTNLSMPRRELHTPSLDTASTTAASSCYTTGSSSPSCYDSMAESSRSAATGYSPPGGSPTLLEELADSSNFVLVPTVSARVSAAAADRAQSPPCGQRRKRSLGQRTKKVLTRLRSSLAVRSSAGA